MANSWQQTFDELGLDQELLEQVVALGPLAGKFLKHLKTDELQDLSKSKTGKEPQKSLLIKVATMIVARLTASKIAEDSGLAFRRPAGRTKISETQAHQLVAHVGPPVIARSPQPYVGTPTEGERKELHVAQVCTSSKR